MKNEEMLIIEKRMIENRMLDKMMAKIM